jgi:hypothetical protein
MTPITKMRIYGFGCKEVPRKEALQADTIDPSLCVGLGQQNEAVGRPRSRARHFQ